MAQSSFPFENIDTTETQYSQLFRTLNNGVNGTPDGGELEVDAASAGLAVDIAAGQAMVRGHFYISTAVETRSLAVADSSNDRIDLVVLRLDPIANTIVLAVKTGTPDPAPVAPALVLTDGGIFEQPLAEVLVPANAGVPSTITDRREFMGTKLGSWTTAGRPIVTDRALFGFNTELQAIEFYNPTTDEWEEITPASIGDIGDVTLTSPSYGQVLSYNPSGDNFTNNPDNNPVMVFDDATARATAIPTPVEGMVTYLKDDDEVTVFDGSAFKAVGPGQILQVVSDTTTTVTATTSPSFQNTSLSGSITPSSTASKVLVLIQVDQLNNFNSSGASQITVFRGDVTGTQLTATANAFNSTSITTSRDSTLMVLDSPSTTSATTYTMGIRSTGASNNAQVALRQNIILMEVAG